MTILSFLMVVVAVLAVLGALAGTFGADSRDLIEDTHTGPRRTRRAL